MPLLMWGAQASYKTVNMCHCYKSWQILRNVTFTSAFTACSNWELYSNVKFSKQTFTRKAKVSYWTKLNTKELLQVVALCTGEQSSSQDSNKHRQSHHFFFLKQTKHNNKNCRRFWMFLLLPPAIFFLPHRLYGMQSSNEICWLFIIQSAYTWRQFVK